MKINNPEKNKIINFFFFTFKYFYSNLILLLKQIVKNKKTIVHNIYVKLLQQDQQIYI